MWDRLSRLFAERKPAWIEAETLRTASRTDRQPLLVDVRGPEEFDGPLGHIEGARNIPLPSLPEHIEELARGGRSIVVVCLTDKRSSQAAQALIEAGAPDVSVLRGGMKAWRGNPA